MEPRHDGTSSFTPNRTPADLCGTAYFQRCAWILAQAAGILGREDDAREYAQLADRIKDAFSARFFDPETNQYAEGSQTSNALPLHLDLVPDGHEEAVVANLVDDIENKWGGHLSTGIIGTDALEQALPRYGRADVMYGIATKTTFPSWGYGVTIGQTTISEDFECSPNRSISMKMFGSIEKFFYKDVAGIGLTARGYRAIAFRPQLAARLDHASASIKTVRGLAAIDWQRDGDSLSMCVTVPHNSSGAVSVPTLGLGDNIVITEGDREVWANGAYIEGADGIQGATDEKDCVTFDVGSGSYSFTLIGGEKRSG